MGSLNVGDEVIIRLDKYIELVKKSNKKNPYATKSVANLWKGLNGRVGTICEIDGDEIWVKGPQGLPRMFCEDALELAEGEDNV
jgi:hypothetical protein